MPVVLLVLARCHARIVRGDEDECTGHAGVGDRKQRVRSDVYAHVLHGNQRTRAAKGRADANLEGHFLIRRPLGTAAQLGKALKDFG